MRLKLIPIIFALAALSANAQAPQGPPPQQRAPQGNPMFRMPKLPDNVVLNLRDTSPRNHLGRSSNNSPTFYVYPDTIVDSLGALELVGKLGIKETTKGHHPSVLVINPVAKKFDEEADFAAFVEIYNASRSGNLKIIGIGSGADFVNNTLLPKANGAIAGVLSIGGKKSTLGKEKNWGVPAYITGKNAKNAAKAFIQAADAKLVSTEGTVTTYVNSAEPLLKVVVNADTKAALDEQFASAWNQIFKKNFRYNNYKHTHYEGGKFGEYGPNELEPYTIWEDLGIIRNVVVQEQRQGALPWIWYEYWPKELVKAAPAKSVPIMVLLHGNGNDPRTQAETSGFIEVAGEDRFFVVEMEWQGSRIAGAMGHDGVESVLYQLLEKYPQLDPSRIYCEGLSAGSMTSIQLGIRKSYLFAAVGGHSGGLFGGSHNGPMSFYQPAMNEIAQKSGFVRMPYFLVTGTADRTIPFYTEDNWKDNSILNAWNAYRKMNGLPTIDKIDFSIDPVFGFELQDRETLVTAKGEGIKVEMGQSYIGDMPIMKYGLIIDYGHWNFKPTARLLWDFFKHYSRDPQTKELKYTK